MSNELQRRIAWAIHRESYLDNEENMPDEPHPGCYEFAQAVIDDLNLNDTETTKGS